MYHEQGDTFIVPKSVESATDDYMDKSDKLKSFFADRMTDTQMGIFCLAGAVATFICGWILVLLCGKICTLKSPVLKAIFWYVTIALLILDPLYLSVLCGFFGGGDMNGIRLLMPEVAVRIIFVVIGVIHVLVIWKYLLPRYKEAFNS